MIHYCTYTNNVLQQTTDEKSADWMHLERPSDEEIETICSRYHLPKDYLTSVLDDEEPSRQEGIQQSNIKEPILLLLQYPHTTKSPSGFQQVETLPFSIVLTKEILITASNHSMDFFVKKSAHQKPIYLPTKEGIALQITWQISTAYNQHLQQFKRKIEELESELRVSTENKLLYELMDIQKSLIYFKGALSENHKVLQVTASSPIIQGSQVAIDYLRDVLVETRQALATTEIQIQLVSQISDFFSAIVSNNLNNVMKILTSITIVLTIPTIIGGIYGMNIPLPIAKRDDAFWIISILTIAVCMLTIYWLKKKKFFLGLLLSIVFLTLKL